PGRIRVPPGPYGSDDRRRDRRGGPGGAAPPMEHCPGDPPTPAAPWGRAAAGRARHAPPARPVPSAAVSRWTGPAPVLGDGGPARGRGRGRGGQRPPGAGAGGGGEGVARP